MLNFGGCKEVFGCPKTMAYWETGEWIWSGKLWLQCILEQYNSIVPTLLCFLAMCQLPGTGRMQARQHTTLTRSTQVHPGKLTPWDFHPIFKGTWSAPNLDFWGSKPWFLDSKPWVFGFQTLILGFQTLILGFLTLIFGVPNLDFGVPNLDFWSSKPWFFGFQTLILGFLTLIFEVPNLDFGVPNLDFWSSKPWFWVSKPWFWGS